MMTIQRTLPDLAGLINAEHDACIAAAGDAIAHALEVGHLLDEAKVQVQHGEWAGWVEANCTFGLRQAQNYMRVYRNRHRIESEMRNGVSHLDSFREAIAALADPRPTLDPPAESSWIPAGIPAAEDPPGLDPVVHVTQSLQEAPGPAVARPVPTITPVPIADLKAPWPYFGGKRRAAGIIWAVLGDPDNYIEPCGGSAANLLARPQSSKTWRETLNDADCYIANFWRATQWAPEEVVRWADWPVNQTDLYARHRWLTCSEEAKRFRERMREDPSYFDPRIAGWWVWGACTWIASGWCRSPVDESRIFDKRPPLCNGNTHYGQGVHRQPEVPDKCPPLHALGVHRQPEGIPPDGRPQLADAYARGRGVHGNDAAETCRERREFLLDWFGRLSDRLRAVRVCCRDWRAVCDSPSTTTRLGLTGIFFDPPYSEESGRCKDLYGVDSLTVAHDIREYCLEHGNDPQFRIVLAGLAGEGHEVLEEYGWTVAPWKSHGGYNHTDAGKDRAQRERLWCSPHTLCQGVEPSLFDGLED
jgi:hypothetical protein